ncbi:MAG: hypothetical protein AB7F28_02880 [Candidatus Margulisiibacteriota bacterium]
MKPFVYFKIIAVPGQGKPQGPKSLGRSMLSRLDFDSFLSAKNTPANRFTIDQCFDLDGEETRQRLREAVSKKVPKNGGLQPKEGTLLRYAAQKFGLI